MRTAAMNRLRLLLFQIVGVLFTVCCFVAFMFINVFGRSVYDLWCRIGEPRVKARTAPVSNTRGR